MLRIQKRQTTKQSVYSHKNRSKRLTVISGVQICTGAKLDLLTHIKTTH